MAKALTDVQRKLRLEMVDLAAQGITTQANNGYYSPAEVEYLTAQLERVTSVHYLIVALVMALNMHSSILMLR